MAGVAWNKGDFASTIWRCTAIRMGLMIQMKQLKLFWPPFSHCSLHYELLCCTSDLHRISNENTIAVARRALFGYMSLCSPADWHMRARKSQSSPQLRRHSQNSTAQRLAFLPRCGRSPKFCIERHIASAERTAWHAFLVSLKLLTCTHGHGII